jgi:hypothetical protein
MKTKIYIPGSLRLQKINYRNKMNKERYTTNISKYKYIYNVAV